MMRPPLPRDLSVVYAGPLNPEGTCGARLRALQQGNSRVHPFDTVPYFSSSSSRWRRALEHLVSFGPATRRLNADFMEFCASVRPDVVWMDKAFWAWPSTLRRLRAEGAFLVQHNTDALRPGPLHMRWAYRVLRKTLPQYDLYLTSNLPDHEQLRAGGFPVPVELTHLGYDHEQFDDTPPPPGEAQRLASELLFVGHYEPETERRVLALVRAGLPVTVYGVRWERARHRRELEGAVKFRTLTSEEYVTALKSTKIGLCFVSQINSNQTAGRTYEIPACGTFLLAARTPAHLETYREGEEAEFFSSDEELVEKARRYWVDDVRRRDIARKGRNRLLHSGYSWADRMRVDWERTLDLFHRHRVRQPEGMEVKP